MTDMRNSHQSSGHDGKEPSDRSGKKTDAKEQKPYAGWIDLALQVSFTFAITVLAGVLGGRWLDNTFDMSPLFLLIGTFWGVGCGIYWMVLKIKQFAELKEKEAQNHEGSP